MQIRVSSLISVPAGLLVLIFFFLPWVTISCGDISIEATGYEMASGTVGEDDTTTTSTSDPFGFGSSTTTDSDEISSQTDADDADIALYLIPAIGVSTLLGGLASLLMKRNRGGVMLALSYFAVSIVGLGIMFLKYLALDSDLQELKDQAGMFVVVSMEYEIGWWGTILMLIMIGLAGIVALVEGLMSAPPAPTAYPYPYPAAPYGYPPQQMAGYGQTPPPNYPPQPYYGQPPQPPYGQTPPPPPNYPPQNPPPHA